MGHPRRHRLTTSLAAALLAAPLALTAMPASAVSGPALSDNSLAFTARLDIGDGQKACSGALVDRNWLLTAASCFADDPAQSLALPAGAPKLKTTAIIGRTDLTTTAGETRTIVDLVPYSSRDVVLARLSRPVTTVTPVGISAAAAAAGEELTVAGYGRTRTEWSPLGLHSGTFTVDSVATDAVGITGKDGASVCMGDTGGPTVRMVGGKPELVALSSRSWQGGCFGIDPAVTQTGAVSARVDDLRDWVASTVAVPRVTDYTGDGKSDVAYLYNYGVNADGTNHTGLWLQTSTGSGFDGPAKPWDSGAVSWDWSRSKLVSGDFNGDGLADVGVLYRYDDTSDGRGHSALWTFTSTGAGFNAPVKVWDSGTGSWTSDSSALVSGDFNGDGLADVGVLYKYGNTSDGRGHSALWTFTSTGTGFGGPVKKWDSDTGSWTWDNSKLVAGDFDGDGKSDVGALYKYGNTSDGRGHSALWTFTSTGTGFGGPVKKWDSDTGSWTWDNSKLVAGDFDGDGKSDVGALYKYGNTSDGRGHSALWTFTSTGTGFGGPVKKWDSDTGSWTWDNSMLVAGDFDGDGKSDVGALYKYGNTSDGRGHSALWTFTSTGTGFGGPVKKWDSDTGSWTWGNSMLVAGDFDGDGKSDVGALYKYGNTSDGRGHSALWTFTSTGTGFGGPVKKWDSDTGSWFWDKTKIG